MSQGLKFKVMLLYAGRYSLIDEQGLKKSGITANYIMQDNLEESVVDNDAKGIRPSKGAIPEDLWHKLTVVPGFYDVEWYMKTGSDGKPVLAVKDLEFVSPIVVTSQVEGKAPMQQK